jgi:hypothetical protein
MKKSFKHTQNDKKKLLVWQLTAILKKLLEAKKNLTDSKKNQ